MKHSLKAFHIQSTFQVEHVVKWLWHLQHRAMWARNGNKNCQQTRKCVTAPICLRHEIVWSVSRVRLRLTVWPLVCFTPRHRQSEPLGFDQVFSRSSSLTYIPHIALSGTQRAAVGQRSPETSFGFSVTWTTAVTLQTLDSSWGQFKAKMSRPTCCAPRHNNVSKLALAHTVLTL